MKMSNELIVTQEEKAFEFLQRKAKAFISGSILPQHYRNTGDVIVLEEMSKSLKIPMIMLAQGLYIVKGKPSMSGQLVIAIINGSGKFDTPLMWEERESPWGVRVYAKMDGEKLYGEWITDELIKLNGWASNPHWKNNKGLMARYRSASWFGRLYCPELLMGFKTEGEVQDSNVIETEAISPTTDINQALVQGAGKAQKTQTPKPTQTAPTVSEDDVVPEPTEEKPKNTRMPRHVTQHYAKLEECGVKHKDLKAFAEHMEFDVIGEDKVNSFFTQADAEIKMYVNIFYGIDPEEATEAEYEEIEPNGEPQSPNEPMASQGAVEVPTQENNTQQPKAGVSLARYNGLLISKGIKPEDVSEFLVWASVDESNIAQFIQDAGAVDALVEQFNAEAGYAKD
jgi:hypothetical protein